MNKKSGNEYNWSTEVDPLIGIPMYDNPRPSGLGVPDYLQPRDGYKDKLTALANRVDENFSRYLLSLAKNVPQEQLTKLHDILRSSKELFLKINSFNFSEFRTIEEYLDTSKEYRKNLTDLLDLASLELKEQGLEIYDNMFRVIPKPFVANYLHQNDLFAYQRVAGNNAFALHGIKSIPSNFPITNVEYQHVIGNSDSLTAALSDSRLYMLNYKNLESVVSEQGDPKPSEGEGSTPQACYSYAAMALFTVSKETSQLVPIAIQCGQTPNNETPLILATDNPVDPNYWAWQKAKFIINSADEIDHQLNTHVASTHLVMEAFSLATLRKLPEGHPIYKLLISHFEGTQRINHNATFQLLLDHQLIDILGTSSLNKLLQLIINTRLSYDFKLNYFPEQLKQRNVDNKVGLPSYPYRDDGLLLWEAIRTWVSEYIDIHYQTSASIEYDEHLQSWMNDILENGKIKGFTKINSKTELVDVLTMIIFTASAQHAAVNFTQASWMMYAPYVNGTLFSSKPMSNQESTQNSWLNMLPNQYRAQQKIKSYAIIGELYHGYLGEYIDWNGNDVFTDFEVIKDNGPLNKFRKRLQEIKLEINTRNATRPFVYDCLIPDRIPASINT